jgi:hypothetical protein
LDPSNAFEVIPIEPAMMDDFERVPLEQLGDPFDRFILATAAYLCRRHVKTGSGPLSVIELARVVSLQAP